MRPVVVFDTNVLFSAVRSGGSPFRCVELAREGSVEAVTCEELLAELADILPRRLEFGPSDIAETLADYLSFVRVVAITGNVLNYWPRGGARKRYRY